MAEFGVGASTIPVVMVNEATTPLGVDLAALASGLQAQFNRDVAPVWGLSPIAITIGTSVPAGAWGFIFLDDADQAGALAYHTLTNDGLPQSRVFVRTILQDNSLVSVGASHELLEEMVDPGLQMGAEDGSGRIYAYEICDPVEDQTYLVDGLSGVAVSDFVYPSWFESFRAPGSVKFNHMGNVQQPFQLTAGGYVSTAFVGTFRQSFGSQEAAARFNPARKGRAVRRALPVGRRLAHQA